MHNLKKCELGIVENCVAAYYKLNYNAALFGDCHVICLQSHGTYAYQGNYNI